MAAEGNTSTQLPTPDPEQVIIIGNKPSKTDPFAWMFPMFEGIGNKVPNESGLKKGSDNTGGQGNLGVMTTVNDKKLLSKKPCTSPAVKCHKQNKEREEAYERWLVGASGAVESICVECYLVGVGGLFKVGYASLKGLFVTEEAGLIFATGANITPLATANTFRTIGANGTFVTELSAFEKVIGVIPINAKSISITIEQARRLETGLGLKVNSLSSKNILSIVENIGSRAPRSPLSGNNLFLGGGNGLPNGARELVIDAIPSAGGAGIRQIMVNVVH